MTKEGFGQPIDLGLYLDEPDCSDDKLNRLARLLYALRGYSVPVGFDFRASQHPHEQEAFAAAQIAWNFFAQEGLDDQEGCCDGD